MIETIIAMTFIEKLFLTFALSGSVVFVIRMILMMLGLAGHQGDGELHDGSGGGHHSISFDSDQHDGVMIESDGADDVGDTDGVDSAHAIDDIHSDVADTEHQDTDTSFRFLSIQGLTSFFMMFGWVGLAIIRDSQMPAWLAVGGGLIAGTFTVWVLSRIFAFVFGLQSDGTMRISHALGSSGTVYLRIPAEGTGQVQIEVDGRLKIFDASSSKKEEIKTGEQIAVVWVQDNGILVVEKDERTEGGKLCGL